MVRLVSCDSLRAASSASSLACGVTTKGLLKTKGQLNANSQTPPSQLSYQLGLQHKAVHRVRWMLSQTPGSVQRRRQCSERRPCQARDSARCQLYSGTLAVPLGTRLTTNHQPQPKSSAQSSHPGLRLKQAQAHLHRLLLPCPLQDRQQPTQPQGHSPVQPPGPAIKASASAPAPPSALLPPAPQWQTLRQGHKLACDCD